MLDKSILLGNEKHEGQSELTLEKQRNDELEKELQLMTNKVKKLELKLKSSDRRKVYRK